MLRRSLSFIAAALLTSSSAMAVNIATDGTGDYLIAPLYTYNNGYQTHLTLMNTDNEHAYLVRGVIRRGKDTREVKDFTLMMSPGDVWTATIADGRIISDDDSNWDENGLDLPVEESEGYIEFFVLAELNNDDPRVANVLENSDYTYAYQSTTVNASKIDKKALKELFAQAIGGYNINQIIGNPDLSLVVPASEISSDAIGGYVRLESTTRDMLSTSIPLFAFENAREKGTSLVGTGFIPGEISNVSAYLGDNVKAIRDLLRHKYISVPYDRRDGGDTQVVLTFILDGNDIDEGNTGAVQDRTYKQLFRNLSEQYPKETLACISGSLQDYIEEKFGDSTDPDIKPANPSISPYTNPTCTLRGGYTLKLSPNSNGSEEVNFINVSTAQSFEASKEYSRVITYQTESGKIRTVVERLPWNDFNPDDYLQGMFQIHDVQNIYDTEDGIKFDDGQTVDGTLQAAYIPTFFDIKIVNGQPFINWNYAITTK